MTRRGARALPGALAVRALAFLALALVAACSPSPTGAPSGLTPGPSTGSATASPKSTPPGKTVSDWGPIWEGIPMSFPLPPGAEPAGEVGEVTSAVFVVSPAGDADALARFYVDAFSGAGYIVDSDGPLEDGSYIVNARRAAGCRMQTRSSIDGGNALLTIQYGADCPWDDA